MNLSQIMCHPIGWLEKVYPRSIQEEIVALIPYLEGKVVEVFCRSGLWGEHLTQKGVDWSGMDPDPKILEHAFLRGMFAVSTGIFPKPNSCDVVLGTMAPFSMISADRILSFVQGIHDSLHEQGSALLCLWEEPNTKMSAPRMYTHNGTEKLVMTCVPERIDSVVYLQMEWMVAKEGEQPYYMQFREERFLHVHKDLSAIAQQFFPHVEVRSICDRPWLFLQKS